MIGILLSIVVTAWLVYMIARKHKPQAVLLIAGIVLLALAIITKHSPLLGPKVSSGSVWLDIFQTIKNLLSEQAGGTGLTIMAIAGFGKYMEHIGASKSLFAVVAAPLKRIRSPYILLVASFFVTQVLVLFIPSHTGLGLLLMATMYPILVRVGVTPLSALAVIGCNQFVDLGPGSSAAIYAAKQSGLDVATYFVHYQLPVYIPIFLAVAITHYFVQRWWDKKEGHDVTKTVTVEKVTDEERPPLVYAILPVIPLFLILGFSPIFKSSIKMDVVTAMIISTGIAMIFELFHLKNVRTVLDSILVFYDGMGKIFVTVVSLIVAGQTYAAGLTSIGAIDALIHGSQAAGLGLHSMIIIASLTLAVSAFLMGSGNAALFSLGPIAAKVATFFHVDIVTLLLPMQIMTSFGRVVSPWAPPMASIALVAGENPIQLVKRTAIPMLVAGILNIAVNFIIFAR